MSGGTEATTGYFVATDGQAYEHFMGRWSSRLAPLFLEFAGIRAADQVLDVELRHRGDDPRSGIVGRERGRIRYV